MPLVEADRLTLRELFDWFRGAGERRNADRKYLAHLASLVLATQGSKLTPAEILGEETDHDLDAETKIERWRRENEV